MEDRSSEESSQESSSQVQAVSVQVPDSLPREVTQHYSDLARGAEAEGLDLSRGQYRASYRIPYEGEAIRVRNRTQALDSGDEFKRVHFYKIDVHPLEEPDPVTGQPVAQVTAVFHVLDNPLPLVPIAWAGLAAAVGGAGWLLMDKAEEVTTSGPLALLPLVAAGLTVYLFVRN